MALMATRNPANSLVEEKVAEIPLYTTGFVYISGGRNPWDF